MSKSTFAGNPNSQYDPGLIAKEVHDFYGQSIRTTDANSLVKNFFTNYRVSYDYLNRPTTVSYYRGTKSQLTKFSVNTIGLNLDGKYFTIRSAISNDLYVVWFDVNNSSVQPVVSGAKYIQIDIAANDTESLIAMAISLTINNLYGNIFNVTRNAQAIEIATAQLGIANPSTEGTTPFVFTQSPGEETLVEKIDISYQGNDPVFQGQVLKGYVFNIAKGQFEVSSNSAAEETLNVDEVSSNLIYIGNAPTGTENSSPNWKISRVSISGGNITVQFAEGKSTYEFIWNNRASLNYE